MFLHLPTKDLCELGKYHNELKIPLCKVLNTFYQYASLSMTIVTRYGSDCTLPSTTYTRFMVLNRRLCREIASSRKNVSTRNTQLFAPQ